MGEYYWFDEHKQPYEVEVHEWARLFDNIDNRRVARTVIGEEVISTVFLGLDHSYGHGPPVLWETMCGDYMWRYTTYEAAARGHVEVVLRVMTGQNLEDVL